jgi:chromate reductase
MKIVAIAGSLRSQSSNAALLRAAAAVVPPGIGVELCAEVIATLPAFNPDLDGEGAVPPAAVAGWRALLRAADGFVIACPEYAHGAPGALKNALDWIVSSGELEGKPTVLLAASPSGGRYAQAALAPTLQVMGAVLVDNVALTFTRRHVNEAGQLVDAGVRATVEASTRTLLAHLAAPPPP